MKDHLSYDSLFVELLTFPFRKEDQETFLALTLETLRIMVPSDLSAFVSRIDGAFRIDRKQGEEDPGFPETLWQFAQRSLVTGEPCLGDGGEGEFEGPWLLVPLCRAGRGEDLLFLGRKGGKEMFSKNEVEIARALGVISGLYEEPDPKDSFVCAPSLPAYHHPSGPLTLVVGKSGKMQQVMERVERVARTEISVFVGGESGTGKELIAREIHAKSLRKAGKFIAVNCSAIPEHLIESELFGHVRGAFTSATADRIGLLEEAQGGTFFLDEIADLLQSTQSKLLRVLQEKEIKRVGDNRFRRVNVRFITATNRDLDVEVKTGRFREDLYYRIRQFAILIPPLRERIEDIPLLAEHFLKKYGVELHGLPVGASGEALDALMAYNWPGNVREFENVIREAVLKLGTTRKVEREHLTENIVRQASAGVWSRSGLRQARTEFDRSFLARALERNRGNKARTARELQMSRQALYNLMRKLAL